MFVLICTLCVFNITIGYAVTYPVSYDLVTTDVSGDTVDGGLDIVELAFSSNDTYYFFRILTASSANTVNDTFGVMINDTSVDNQFNYVIATYLNGNDALTAYEWTGTVWNPTDNYEFQMNHRFNSGINSIEFAIPKTAYAFGDNPIDPANDYLYTVSTETNDSFETALNTIRNPTPSNSVLDDVTSIVLVPEFSVKDNPLVLVLLLCAGLFLTKRRTN